MISARLAPGKLLSRLPSFASILTVALALATSPSCFGADGWAPRVGIQTYTLRNLNFDQAIAFSAEHGLKDVQLSSQVNPKAPREELEKKRDALAAKGLTPYTFGVNDTSLDKEENRKLFEFAKLMGLKLIIVEPRDFKIWDNLEELAKEYDMRVAVHNHGIKSLYGNPAVVKNILKHRDARLGVCLDVGWVTAAGFDAAKVFREYEGRVFDIHLKDKRIEKVKEGDDVAIDTEIGAGQANLKGLLAELKASHWQGVLAIETDSPELARNPAPFVDGAVRYVKDQASLLK